MEQWKVAGADALTSFKKGQTHIAVIPSNTCLRSNVLDKILADDAMWLVTEKYAIYCCQNEIVLDDKEKPEGISDTDWRDMWWEKVNLVSYTHAFVFENNDVHELPANSHSKVCQRERARRERISSHL